MSQLLLAGGVGETPPAWPILGAASTFNVRKILYVIDQFVEDISENECVDIMDEIAATADDYDEVTEEILCKAEATVHFRG